MHESNVYPKLRQACRSEAAIKQMLKAAKTRISNKDQHAGLLDHLIAAGELDNAIKQATKDVKQAAKAELPDCIHRWLDNTPHMPRLIMYRIIGELGGRIDVARGPRSLRHIAGVFPVDGHAVRRRRGEKLSHDPLITALILSPAPNGLMNQIRRHKVQPFVDIIEAKKVYLASRGDDPPKEKWWIEATALRHGAQQILNELWEVVHLGQPRRWAKA